MNEITSSTLYWVTRLDGIKGALVTLLLLCVVVIIAAGCIAGYYTEIESGDYGMNKEDSRVPQALKWAQRGLGAFTLSIVLYVLTPTTTEMVAIVVLPQIAQSKMVQQDMPELYSLAVEGVKRALSGPEKGRTE